MLHLKKNNSVVNTVAPGGRLRLPDGTVVMPARAGWSMDGYSLVEAPSPPEPEPPTAEELLTQERAGMVCSRFQAKAALHQAGLLAQVEAELAHADTISQLAWADATEFRRNSPTIASLAGALGLTPEQIDDLFHAAMQIEA